MGKLGGDMLERMRDSLEDIKFHEKKKTEIKDLISDWEEEKILKEILLLNNNQRSSVNSFSRGEKFKEVFTVSVRNQEMITRYKHKLSLHALRAEIYREFIKRIPELIQEDMSLLFVKPFAREFDLEEEEVQDFFDKQVEKAASLFRKEYSPDNIVDRACKNRDDLEEKIENDLEELEIEFPDKGENQWYYT